MKTPFDDAVAKLVDLAREGFSRGWDRFDRADKHDAIADAIGGIHAEWMSLVDEREQLRATIERQAAVVQAAKEWRACFDDDGEIISRPRLGDAEVKLSDAIDALTATEQTP